MKKLITAAALTFGLSTSAYAVDPCTNPDEVQLNSWALTINDEDASSKDDLLRTLQLLGTGGFSITNILANQNSFKVHMFVQFRASYYRDADRAADAKESVLSELLATDGIKVTCDSLNIIAPSIGVRSI